MEYNNYHKIEKLIDVQSNMEHKNDHSIEKLREAQSSILNTTTIIVLRWF